MTNSRTKNTVSGLIFKAVAILLPFAVRTVLIYKLGMEYLGLGTLFTSLLEVLSLSELGFSTAIAYSMFKPVAEGKKQEVCALLNLIKKIYRIIGIVILCVGLILTPFLPNLIYGDIPQDINLYLLYFIYLFNTSISYFLFAYTSSLLAANQRTDVENVVSLIANIFMYVFQILALVLFQNYYVYIIFLPLTTIVINLLKYRQVKKIFPEYVCSGIVQKEQKKLIYKNIGALMGHKLSGAAITSISGVIIPAFFGLTISGVYGSYYYVLTALFSIITIVYVSLTASIGNSIVVDSVEKNYKDFKTLTFCNVWLVGWMAITLICLYQHFMGVWIGTEILFPMRTVILFTIYFYLWKFKDMLSTYKDAAGMWRNDWLKPYVVTIVSVVLSLILVNFIGIDGVIVGGIAGVFVVSMPWETHVFFKSYFKRKEWFYYLRMLIYTVVIFLLGVLTYYLCSFVTNTGIVGLILKFLICVSVPNVLIVLFSFKTPEFKALLEKVKHILKKKTKNKTKVTLQSKEEIIEDKSDINEKKQKTVVEDKKDENAIDNFENNDKKNEP